MSRERGIRESLKLTRLPPRRAAIILTRVTAPSAATRRRAPLAPRAPFAVLPITLIAAAKLALHLVVLAVTRYGVHRDEFLYFAMGEHLRLWSMDFPPAIAVLANVARALFGDSLAAVRVLPAVEGTALVVIAALVAREVGGGAVAQAFGAFAVLTGTLFLRSSTLFQPVVLDQLWWTAALFSLARVARGWSETDERARRRWWLAVGVTLGAGLLTKFSILFIGLAILLAVLGTPLRRDLATPWPWVAAAIAFVIGSPSIAGQIALGWPVLGQMRALQGSQLERVTYLSYLGSQPLLLSYVGIVPAAIGAWSLCLGRLRDFRVVGLACLIVFLLLMLLHGKAYYVGPIYPTLLAAGAVVIERVRGRVRTPVVRWGTALVLAIFGIVALPLAVPVLTPERTARYAAGLGADRALRTNLGAAERLPQDYADMLGWEAQVRATARVYRALPPDERRAAVIIGDNYGECGAIDFYRRRYTLPSAVCPSGSYWFFGPGALPGRVVVKVGGDRGDLAPYFASVIEADRISSPWSVAEERDVAVWVAREPHRTLQEVWQSLAGIQ